jgi:DNA-binding NarL/FixJ family response regulator
MARAEFVGRERELDTLAGLLADALGGEPRVVLCGGEPGIGKTRLAEELVALAYGNGVPAVWGASVEAEGAPPYWPWRQVLRAVSTFDGAVGVAEQLRVAEDLAVVAPESFPQVAGPPHDLDSGPEQRFRVFDGVTRFLRRMAQDRGLLVVLDDLQWADPASLLLLQHLACALGPSGLFVLATFRDTEPRLRPILAELIRQPGTSRLEVAGLTSQAVGRQLELLTGRLVPGATVARVYELTGGNPFFVAELARSLDSDDVPDTVRGAIRRRMDRLSPQCRHQLRVAAIVGREFSVAVVAAIIGRPVLACLDALEDAVAAGLVEPAATTGEHRFTHALVRDAIEADLSTVERIRLHQAAAEAIESFYVGRLDPYLTDLARHWTVAADAGGRDRAVLWSRRAADEAMSRLSYEEAARLYRQALECGSGLDDMSRHGLLLSLAQALRHSAELARAVPVCNQAAEAGRRLGRADLIGEAALVMDPVEVLQWDAPVREMCAEALAGLGTQTTPLRARVLARLAEISMYLGDLDEAAVTSEAALAAAASSSDRTAMIAALHARQVVCSGPEGVDERDRLAAQLLQIGMQLDSPATKLLAYSWRVDVCFARGDLAGVAAELENLRWWVEQAGGPTARWHLLRQQAALAQARGDFTAARQLADAAFDAIAPLRHPAAFPVRMALLVTVDHHCGADPDAFHVKACLEAGPGSAATPGHAFQIMDHLCPAMVLNEAGYVREAAAKLRATGPVATWRVPPFHQLIMYAIGVIVGIRVNARDAVSALRDLLNAHRGRHVVPAPAVPHYMGPVELYLGMAASYLGEVDAAIADLRAAVSRCQAAGAVAHLAEAQYELASALARKGDKVQARSFAAQAMRAADAMGMVPFRGKLARLTSTLADTGGPLTPRERDVAACVSRGMTNRQIAADLYVSERTAQNHVQHILTKLGFTNRSQIAAWAATHTVDSDK